MIIVLPECDGLEGYAFSEPISIAVYLHSITFLATLYLQDLPPALSVVRTAKPVDMFRFSLIFISFSPFEYSCPVAGLYKYHIPWP